MINYFVYIVIRISGQMKFLKTMPIQSDICFYIEEVFVKGSRFELKLEYMVRQGFFSHDLPLRG